MAKKGTRTGNRRSPETIARVNALNREKRLAFIREHPEEWAEQKRVMQEARAAWVERAKAALAAGTGSGTA